MAQDIIAPIPTFDESGAGNYTPIQRNDYGENVIVGYKDNNGNLWSNLPTLGEEGWIQPKLLLSAKVASDPYIANLNLARDDPAKAQELYNLKQSSPSDFYKEVAPLLEEKLYQGYGANANYTPLYNQLQDIKNVDPTVYYENQLKFLGQQAGWQIGQNTDPSGAYSKIQSLIPEAQKAGLSTEKINSLVGESINQANTQNQQRIANEAASGGNFWTENLIGAAKVGALALGAGGLDAALNAGATGINGALQSYLGTTGGAFVPAEGFSATLPGFSTGASAITQALPYTEAYDAANLASQGLNSAAIEQNLAATGLNPFLSADMASLAAQGLSESQIASTLAASYTPAELAGTGIQSLNWAGNAIGSGLLSNAGNLLKGASLAKGLLGAGKNPAVNQPMGVQPMQQQQKQYAGVDYSPILNLLAVKSPERTRTSLLG